MNTICKLFVAVSMLLVTFISGAVFAQNGVYVDYTPRGVDSDSQVYFSESIQMKGSCTLRYNEIGCVRFEFVIPLAISDGSTHQLNVEGGFRGGSRPISAPRPSYAHLPYFGYWYSTYKDNGGNSTITAEVADHVNTAFVVGFLTGGADPWSDVKDLLNEAKSRGMKAVLTVPAWGANGAGGLSDCPLNSDWMQRLSSWSTAINPYVSDGTIVALFVIDEPKANCIAPTSTVNAFTKSLQPTLPIWINMYGGDIAGAWPSGFDWISFDLYGQPFSVVENTFYLMKSRLQAGQRTLLFPEGSNDSSPADDMLMAQYADDYLRLAQDTSVIGVFPFLWRHTNYIGISSFPIAQARYKTFGQSFVGR